MDRGVWQATIHGVSESDTTELLTHTHVSFQGIDPFHLDYPICGHRVIHRNPLLFFQ